VVGRQTVFFSHPDDYAALAKGLHERGAVIIAEKSPIRDPVIYNLSEASGFVSAYFTHWRFLPTLQPRYVENLQMWLYSSRYGPLIELFLRQPRDGVLEHGRVYFETRFVVEDEYVEHSAEFVAFAEQARGWIRRWCKRRDGLLLTPSLAILFDRGDVLPADKPGTLKVLTRE
jgi:hypothetical protein